MALTTPLRCQALRHSDVVNYTPLGQRLAAFARRNEPYHTLWAAGAECGFQDGGCVTLARALAVWSAGELRLAAVFSDRQGDREPIEHVVAATQDGYYLDSDGVATAAELRARMEWMERHSRLRVAAIAPVTIRRAVRAGNGYYPKAVPALAALLHAHLGAYRPPQEWLPQDPRRRLKARRVA